MKFLSSTRAACSLALFVSCLLTGAIVAQNAHTTNEFHGVKVDAGTSRIRSRATATSLPFLKISRCPKHPIHTGR